MIAKKMEIIVIEDVSDFEDGEFARFMDNTDGIILVNPESVRDSKGEFDFDDDAEYNMIDYDFDKASAEIEWE